MSLLGEVRQAQAAHRVGGVCGIRRVLERLDPAEAEELRVAMDDPAIMHSTIARVLKSREFDVGDQTVARHRNGICRCET